jgi:hypothetical protein
VSRDRRAGAALFIVAALVFGITTATSDSVLPPVHHNEVAYHELLALLDANEAGTWIVHYDVRRTLDTGKQSAAEQVEARGPNVHIVRGGGTADATIGDTRYICAATTDAGVVCNKQPAPASVEASAVVREAVAAGAYVVMRGPNAQIAGEPARCYRLFATGGYLPALGAVSQECFAADGVDLRTTITSVNDERERVAARVRRAPEEHEFEDLMTGLDVDPGSAGNDEKN